MRQPVAVFCGIVMIGSVFGIASAQVAVGSGQTLVAVAPGTSQPADASNAVSDRALDPVSLLPDLPSLPTRKTSVIGGTIDKLDRVRDQFTVRVFGGGKMRISFDPRTQVYEDGRQASASSLRPGDRVYVDTVLSGDKIFARNIRLKSAAAGEIEGTVVSYQADRRELTVRDALSPHPMKLVITSQTQLSSTSRSASVGDLVPGALVAVKFGAQSDHKDGANPVQEVSVLALPGASITFAGTVRGLDLSTGLLVLTSATDGKTYEIYLDPQSIDVDQNLREAANVTVLTSFEGDRYVARSLTVN